MKWLLITDYQSLMRCLKKGYVLKKSTSILILAFALFGCSPSIEAYNAEDIKDYIPTDGTEKLCRLTIYV